MTTYTEVNNFWFSENVKPLWFNSTPEFDQVIRDRFLDCWEEARQGHLEEWKDNAMSSLALVIVLDQFPLNIFRGDKRSFETESMSRIVAMQAIANGYDQELDSTGKAFLYLPFMHSEDIEDQNLSVALFEKNNLRDNLKWAKHHREIIRKFGRFPHRNVILGRESTSEEIEYLNSASAFLG